MGAAPRRWAADILYTWFHALTPSDWYRGGQHVDALLRRRFQRDLLALWPRPAHEFLGSPDLALAAVLLFDQRPRNLYRDQRRAFAFDPLARSITRAALSRGLDSALTRRQRQFLAMPLMHSENISDQRRALDYYAALGRDYGFPFARSHYRMIARFGRFPHRNMVLGRASTPAEKRAIEAGFSW